MAFTVVEASVGALFMQLATTNYYWQVGQTVGFSSMIYNTIFKKDFKNMPFFTGIAVSCLVVSKRIPGFLPDFPTSNLINDYGMNALCLFSIAGFLVGLGSKIGGGCTSGHMLSGLSRLRVRSIAAVATFASSAIALNKILGLSLVSSNGAPNYTPVLNWGFFKQNPLVTSLLATGFIQVYFLLPYLSKRARKGMKCIIGNYVRILSGFLFGMGLHTSGMINVSKTIGFLSILDFENFDPSLLMIMIFAVGPNIFIWRNIEKPLLVNEFDCATSTEIPPKFLLGNVLFGLGWGLLGVCPGPGVINSIHFRSVDVWLVSFLTGYGVGTFV